MTFFQIGFTDILDIILVAFLFYQIYMLTKGTGAIKIITGVAVLYFIWLLVKALNMKLLSSILAQVMGVGVIALLIVFQQEIRSFFLHISNTYLSKFELRSTRFFYKFNNEKFTINIQTIVSVCKTMAETGTGALMVICRKFELLEVINTGTKIDAEISGKLIENIFFKNSPLHDGAMVISKNRIKAASCILPVSKNKNIPDNFGLRHRAGIGITEQTDAVVVVVSEETGKISVFERNSRNVNLSELQLKTILTDLFAEQEELENKETGND